MRLSDGASRGSQSARIGYNVVLGLSWQRKSRKAVSLGQKRDHKIKNQGSLNAARRMNDQCRGREMQKARSYGTRLPSGYKPARADSRKEGRDELSSRASASVR